MSVSDIVLLLAQLVGAWSMGFAGGYLLSVFKKAMNAAV